MKETNDDIIDIYIYILKENQFFFFLTSHFHFHFLSLFTQVFVANPNKSKPILDILLKNKDKLVDFLSKFHTERQGKGKKKNH